MAIPKINVSFKSSLSEKIKNNSEQPVSSDEKVSLPQKQETEDSYTPSSENLTNNNKKYWIISLGSIVGITGLIFAGRKGLFGRGIKNFLHGRKTPHSPKPGNNSGERTVQVSQNNIQIPNVTEPKPEPKINDKSPKPEMTKQETPPVPKTPPKKPVVTTSVPITDEIKTAIGRINSVIDNNVPQILDKYKTVKYKSKEELMKLIKEDVDLKSIDKSKCEPWFMEEGTYKYSTKLKSGEEILIIFNKDMQIKSFEKNFKTSNNLVCIPRKIYFNREGNGNIQYRLEDYIDVTLDKDSKFIDAYCHADKDLILNYNSDGRIISAEISPDAVFSRKYGINSKYKRINVVMYDESGNVSEIQYFDKQSGLKLKTQKFNENGLCEETYNINGEPFTISTTWV